MKKGVDYIGVAVGAMIINDEGKLFLAKRSQTVKNERGHWETPGGSVKFGELLEDAVRRELREEFGVELDIIQAFPAVDHLIPADKQHWVGVTYLANIRPGSTPRILEPDKCDQIGWFALDALPDPLSIITKLNLKDYHGMVNS
jgi:mutator protein MutT